MTEAKIYTKIYFFYIYIYTHTGFDTYQNWLEAYDIYYFCFKF